MEKIKINAFDFEWECTLELLVMVVPDYMVMDNYNALKDKAILLPYVNCGHSPMVDCLDKLVKDVEEFFVK